MTVNGRDIELQDRPGLRLLDALRDDLGLMGAKEGCGIGECGACTVLLNGRAVNSCLVLLAQCEGAQVETVESTDATLAVLREAFLQEGAVQCGFCTPGMLMSALALLRANPAPDRDDVIEALEGNLCRCTGYVQIIDAVLAAAGEISR
ncbi:MAG: (2Fe-2S)-binding protein [Candidatus Cloacimonetes bacterium]|nr:(2Fe-2S)-binding protein [Candidatus Cloacimonadota bacterium]